MTDMMILQNITLSDFDGTKIKLIGTVISFTIGVITIILNLIAILAIFKIRGSLPVNIRLVCCLVASDLLVSLVVILETSTRCIFHSFGDDVFGNVTTIDDLTIHLTLPSYYPCFALILHVLRYTGYNGTLLSLTALAADLYIAIMYPLNYTSMMRKDRVNLTIVFIFVVALLIGGCVLYVPLINVGPRPPLLKADGYCFTRWHQHMKSSFVTFGVIILSVVIVTIVYLTVFYEIRNFHKNAARCPRQPYRYALATTSSSEALNVNQGPVVTRGSSNMKRNQRGLTTTLILLLAFLLCFSPSFISEVYILFITGYSADEYQYVICLVELLSNLPLICSALDPLLYSYRLKDIKLSYLKLFCCYNDNVKPILPPFVAGRARPHPNVQIYFPTHRRSVVGLSSSRNSKQSTPWSERIARAAGIYIDRIRKFSGTQSNFERKSRQKVSTSSVFYTNEASLNDRNRQLLFENMCDMRNRCFTSPRKFPIRPSCFISAPKMVLCPWQYANGSLRDSWLNEDNFQPTNPEKATSSLKRHQRHSTYSSTECGHSGSIDSGNTNSTSASNSIHHPRSKSVDNSSLRHTFCKNNSIQIERIILENY